ncbi:hypothetical protein [Bifidobacterium sp. ESL0704]|nr:hypothetical protein [Bifidobacterium sp. ESL0704]WEV53405.1 hypothetical protein OZX64_02695 [Bifidobacterium sp. ESL0704]
MRSLSSRIGAKDAAISAAQIFRDVTLAGLSQGDDGIQADLQALG